MEAASERIESLAGATADARPSGAGTDATALAPASARPASRLRAHVLAGWQRVRFALAVYMSTRIVLLVVAFANGALRHHSLTHELANWDGLWYRALAHHGYPGYAPHHQSTLGFFPLYPLVVWVAAHVLVMPWSSHSPVWSFTVAGVIVSGIGGLVATVIVQRLATRWWGEEKGRRATVLFCLFPGSVVFSMVYAEGLLIPLAAACLLALERRRWLLAGILAGLATATEPEAVVLVLVCAASALLELRRRGWRDPAARLSLLAPVLSLSGISAFAGFLWAWTGTPFASLVAQRYGWQEKSDPFALVHLARTLGNEISFTHFNHPTINLNLVVGLLGAIVLLAMLVLMYRARRRPSAEAIVWTLGIGLLTVTSEYTPPNPRLLITAFPAVMVLGYAVKRRGYAWLAATNGALLAGMSALTFIGTTLRP